MIRGGGLSTLVFILYLLLGFYFINFPLQFFKIPTEINAVNNWIIFIGGILLILGAINFMRVGSRRRMPSYY